MPGSPTFDVARRSWRGTDDNRGLVTSIGVRDRVRSMADEFGVGVEVASAVVVDRWPLVRIGLARVAEKAGLVVGAETSDLGEGVEVARRLGASMLLVGDGDPTAIAGLRRAAAVAAVVTLVGSVTREELTALFVAGVTGVALRSSAPDELADVVRRASVGERALAAALLPILATREVSAAEPLPAVVGVGPGEPELTAKERRVLVALAAGATNQEIAAELYLSPATVKTHLSHIYAKLAVRGRHEALSRAVALGLVR